LRIEIALTPKKPQSAINVPYPRNDSLISAIPRDDIRDPGDPRRTATFAN
jgi:hypothetical protein